MRWELHRALPLLLLVAKVSPANVPHDESNRLHQAAFRVNDALEEPFLEWGQPPNPNSTQHLIFNSVSSLMQRWPNTHRRNGVFYPFNRPLSEAC